MLNIWKFTSRFLFYIIGILLLSSSLAARANDDDGTFAFILDNDLFAGTDKNYTNGVRFSWLSEKSEADKPGVFGSGYAGALKHTLKFLPVFGDDGLFHNASLALQQVMITPEEISAEELLPDQAPYVGILTVDTGLYAWNERRFHKIQFAFGVIGPDSGAEIAQKFVHKISGATEPRGWGNQVGQKYIGELSYAAGHRVIRRIADSGYGWDLTLDYELTLSNLLSAANIAGIIRWGHNLPLSFNTYYADSGSESALLGLFDQTASGWYLYAALISSATAYNYIEEAIEETHNLSAETFMGSAVIGASYFNKQFQVGFGLQTNTSSVREDEEPLTFGSIYLVFNI